MSSWNGENLNSLELESQASRCSSWGLFRRESQRLNNPFLPLMCLVDIRDLEPQEERCSATILSPSDARVVDNPASQ